MSAAPIVSSSDDRNVIERELDFKFVDYPNLVINGAPEQAPVETPVVKRARSSRATGKGSGANQSHGFDNELRLVTQHDLLHMKDDYTAPWDAYTKGENPVPVSIKTKSARGAVEMGDFFRNGSKTEDFYLVCSFWKGAKDNIVSENILYLPKDYWVSQFPDLYNDEIRDFMAEITNDYSDDAKWKSWCKQLKAKWAETGSLVKLAPKRDHKSQKRMQCVIPYANFLEMAKTYEVPDFKSLPAHLV